MASFVFFVVVVVVVVVVVEVKDVCPFYNSVRKTLGKGIGTFFVAFSTLLT